MIAYLQNKNGINKIMKKILIAIIFVSIILISIGIVTAGNLLGKGNVIGENDKECICLRDGKGNCILDGEGKSICEGNVLSNSVIIKI